MLMVQSLRCFKEVFDFFRYGKHAARKKVPKKILANATAGQIFYTKKMYNNT